MEHIYHDKHGRVILAGMTIRHDNGETEKVYATDDGYGNDDFGICATNPDFAARHPDWDTEYYALSAFRMSEWEIVE